MDVLIQTAEKRITEARDLKPGDIIGQEFLDVVQGRQVQAHRDIRLDRVLSAYLLYAYEGRTYLVPVVTLHGWDVRQGRGVRITCTSRRPWAAMRPVL